MKTSASRLATVQRKVLSAVSEGATARTLARISQAQRQSSHHKSPASLEFGILPSSNHSLHMAMVNMDVESGHHSTKDRIEAMMAENQSEILAVKEAGRRLRQRKYELKRLMNDTTSIMSSLPREVVSEIFLTLCEIMHVDDHATCPTQFLIGSVCKGWREIAWTTPLLWRKISIWFAKKRYDTQKCLLEEWIKRSAYCPLDLAIRSWPPAWQPPVDAFRPLLQHCHRWETLDSIAFQNLASALKRRKNLQFSLLKTVRLHGHDDNNIEMLPLPKWRFDCAPLLHDLDIRGVMPERYLSMNWNSLTRLSTYIGLHSRADAKKCCISMNVLASCQSLSSLKCYILNSDSQTFDQTRCHLPYLEDMELEGMESNAVFFLEQTTVPALKTFNLSIAASGDEFIWMEAVVDLAERSSFKLAILKLHLETEDSGDDGQIADMLRQLSRSNPIKELKLSYSSDEDNFYFSDSIVEVLTMDADGDDEQEREHFPMLSRFEYRGNASFEVETMSRMLESRIKYQVRRSQPKKSIVVHDNPQTCTNIEAENSLAILVGSASHDMVADHSYPIDSLAATELSIDIVYRNRDWFEDQNPNSMRSFYQAVEAFATEGRSFDLVYITHDEFVEGDSNGDEE